MALPKWTEERTEDLRSFVGNESPITQETVAEAAERLETTPRSVSSKLRKMDYVVELASERNKAKAFTPEQEATLQAFVENNSGEYTYAQIAEHFEGGAFSAKSIQGKILSMQLTAHVQPAPKAETTKTYSDEEETQIASLVVSGASMEDIAEQLGRSVPSIRGKTLSMTRAGVIEAMPKQATVKGTSKADPFAELGDISTMTVEQIAAACDPVKTARGVKTMLTRRQLVAADYDGLKKAKAAE